MTDNSEFENDQNTCPGEAILKLQLSSFGYILLLHVIPASSQLMAALDHSLAVH